MEHPEKKILIISYYWPPAGGPGVQRWLKFSKYLPEFGYTPVLFVPENASYPFLDESLLKEIPKNLKIIRTPIWEPYRWAEKLNPSNKKLKAGQFDLGKNKNWKSKLSIWIRGNFFIPDARVFWVMPSIRHIQKLLKKEKFEAIITTGPPHSVHLIGLGLKKIYPNLKWIADFRDPWTEISYYKHLQLTKYADRKHHQLEREVLQKADLVIATSYTDAEHFKLQNAKHSICITNGYDTEFTAENIHLGNQQNQFILSYVGVLEQLRNPNSLWKALSELCEEQELFKQELVISFVGKTDDKIIDYLKEIGLASHLQITEYVPHQKAIEKMLNADILLLTNFPEQESKGIIPGKIFEYLTAKKPILSFGPEASDVEQILQKTKVGKHFTYSTEIEEIKTYILSQFYLKKEGKNEPISPSIETFSRKKLTEELVKYL